MMAGDPVAWWAALFVQPVHSAWLWGDQAVLGHPP